MLHIILLILKIIGIILLCVLGIVLLAVLGALFVPVRYRIEVTREEEEGRPPFMVCVKVTWMLHLVNILVRYPAEVIVRVRLLLFTLFRIPEKEKQGQTQDVSGKGKRTGKGKDKIKPQDTEKKPEQTENIEPQDKPEETVQKAADDTENSVEEREFDGMGATGTHETPSGEGIFKQATMKIKSLFENIQYTIRKLCDKIKSALDNIQYYRDVLESGPFKQSLGLCRKELGDILRKLKPDTFEADLIVGMDDPAVTGEILAVWGMLYPFIGQHVRIDGDFECNRVRIEGSLYIKGKVRAFTFLKAAIRIYFNKDIKTLIKLLKKEAV